MVFLREQNKSILQKTFILICLCSAVSIAVFTNRNPLHFRQMPIIVCVIIYILRLFLMLFVFLKRRMMWFEAFEVAIPRHPSAVYGRLRWLGLDYYDNHFNLYTMNIVCLIFRLVTIDSKLMTRCEAPYEYRNKIKLF